MLLSLIKLALNMKIKISLKAYADLENIYDYTSRHWGVAQAENYRSSLDHTFNFLKDNPKAGMHIPDFELFRKFTKGQHSIIYRVTSDAIFIYRVRHVAQKDIGV